MKNDNKLYQNYLENYEIENETIRTQLSEKNKYILELEEKVKYLENEKNIENENNIETKQNIESLEEENKYLQETVEKLNKKKEVYLNIITKWEDWYSDIMEE